MFLLRLDGNEHIQDVVFQILWNCYWLPSSVNVWWAFYSHVSPCCWESIGTKYNHTEITPTVTDFATQPLNVACFWLLKREWEGNLHKHISKYGIRQPLTKSQSVNELCAMWNTGMKRCSIISGFEASGTVFKICEVVCVIIVKVEKKISF